MEQTAIRSNRTLQLFETGSFAESVIGAGALTVAVVALAGIYPRMLLSVATIAIGASLLVGGGAISARMKEFIYENRAESSSVEVGTGITAEVLGGIGGIGLGVLALLGILPMMLAAVAAIVYGGTLLSSSGMVSRLNRAAIDLGRESEFVKKVSREAVSASAGVQLMIGLGAITLGILALLGINQLVLLLIAMLGLGASELLSGSAIGNRFMSVLER